MMSDKDSDEKLRTLLADHIAEMEDKPIVVVGYALVAEVASPDEDSTWLKTLADTGSAPWTQIGRSRALVRTFEMELDRGWDEDHAD